MNEQIKAAEEIVRLNPEWYLVRNEAGSLFSHSLVHVPSGTLAHLYGDLWQGPDVPDESGDIPLYRKPASALKALGFNVVSA